LVKYGDLVGDRSVLCYAYGKRIDLEEFHLPSGLRVNCLRPAKVRATPQLLAVPDTPAKIWLFSSIHWVSRDFNVGTESAGGILAVILANIVAYFLVRMLAKNLKGR
jgi:hypothetical protein